MTENINIPKALVLVLLFNSFYRNVMIRTRTLVSVLRFSCSSPR